MGEVGGSEELKCILGLGSEEAGEPGGNCSEEVEGGALRQQEGRSLSPTWTLAPNVTPFESIAIWEPSSLLGWEISLRDPIPGAFTGLWGSQTTSAEKQKSVCKMGIWKGNPVQQSHSPGRA